MISVFETNLIKNTIGGIQKKFFKISTKRFIRKAIAV